MRQPLTRLLLALSVGLLSWPVSLSGQASGVDDAARLAALADSAFNRQTVEDLRAAVALGARAAALYHRAGKRREEAEMLHKIGKVYTDLERPDSALAYFQRALPTRRAAGDREGEGRTLNNIGTVYSDLGRPDSALAYYRRSLLIEREVGDRRTMGMTLNNIGVVYDNLGRPDSALASYRQALLTHREAGDRSREGGVLSNIGVIYDNLGRPDSALAYYQQALLIHREVGDRRGEGGTLSNIGALYDVLGRPDSALVYDQRGLFINRDVGDRRSEGRTLDNIGYVYTHLGRPDSALVYYQQVRLIAREVGDRENEGRTLTKIGEVYAKLRRTDLALSYYRQSLAIAREVDRSWDETETLRDLGVLYLRQLPPRGRDPARAAAYFDSAAAVAASIRGQAGGDANRVSFAELGDNTFADWALAWLGRSAELGEEPSRRGALAVTERGRAQALLDLLRRPAQQAGRSGGLGEALARPGADLVAEADSLLAPLRRTRSAALSYLVTADTLVSWLALPSGEVHVSRAAIPRDTLAGLVRALRAGLDAGPAVAAAGRGSARRALTALEMSSDGEAPPKLARVSAEAALARLAVVLLPAELERVLPAGADLVIVPHGALALAPFGMLPAGRSGEPLGLRYALRFAPSLAALNAAERRAGLTSAQGRRPGAFVGALVVGNPAMPALPGVSRGAATLAALPGAEREGRWVAGRLGTRALTGRAATESAVTARLPRASLVHFATHALAFDSDARARESFLVLAPDAASDGLLTVGEVLDDPTLKLQADLVVLSGCQTGLGTVKQAEGIVGLERAFLARGARSVLVSLWSVSDEATELLMRRFYTHWLDDRDAPTKAEALRRAQRDVRATRGFGHPRYWAAFQLVGAG